MANSVSIIVPCYNEQAAIRSLLEAIHAQTYPLADLEVVIAYGMSTDQTRAEIAAYADEFPDLHIAVVDNPKRIIPAALNRALGEAQGEIIVRLDAHSMPYSDYVERCVADLEAGLGESVGGVWEIRPGAETWLAQSIAAAASHPLGVGDPLSRRAEKAAAVDTVRFGAFKRELLALVGFFDEMLLTNEDYEFNARVRKTGGVVWLDPAIRSVYFAPPTLMALAEQYARCGFWKYRLFRRYPETLRWRPVLPLLFGVCLAGLGVLGIFWLLFRVLLAALAGIYILILIVAGIREALQKKRTFHILGLPLAFATLHTAWGAGFLWGMIKTMFTKPKPEKK